MSVPYRGLSPFEDSDEDRALFKGRAREQAEVLNTVLSEPLTLLFSQSGMGKTSLINAGLLAPLRARGYLPVVVRLTHDAAGGPIASLYACVEREVASAGARIVGSGDGADGLARRSLWEFFYDARVVRGDMELRPLLILDQFDELFTTIRGQGDWEATFVAQLADLVRRRVPDAVQREAEQRLDELEDAPPGDPERARLVALLYEEASADVKVLISIREDFLPDLQTLRGQIPTIFKNAIRLGPLSADQAREAIALPAREEGVLGTNAFSFGPGAVDEILAFLRTQRREGQDVLGDSVEPAQLQIVCSYLDRRRRSRSAAEITCEDVRGEQGMRRAIVDFYTRVVNRFPLLRAGPSPQRRLSMTNFFVAHLPRVAIRELCEDALVTHSGHRTSLILDDAEHEIGVPRKDLDALVVARLLRVEARLNSWFYELSHDTLLRPIAVGRRSRHRRRSAGLAGLVLIAVPALMLLLRPYIEPRWERYQARRQLERSMPGSAARATVVKRLTQEQGYTDFANLRGAMRLDSLDLRDIRAAYNADFGGSQLRGAHFDHAELSFARFDSADLSRATFTGAHLRRAGLARAVLRGADLADADLGAADLRGAILDSVLLVGADIEKADVTGARITGIRCRNTAWWLAYGWTPGQIDFLQRRWPHEGIVGAPLYAEQLDAMTRDVQGAATPLARATALNARAWFRATRGVGLDSAFRDVDEAIGAATRAGLPVDPAAYDTRGYISLQLDGRPQDPEMLRRSGGRPLLEAARRDLRLATGGTKPEGEHVYHLALAELYAGSRDAADDLFRRSDALRYRPSYELLLTPQRRRPPSASVAPPARLDPPPRGSRLGEGRGD